MIGIEALGYYICENRESNIGKVFDGIPLDMDPVMEKVGIKSLAVKKDDELISDICVNAFNNMTSNNENVNVNDIEFVCLITHVGDYISPHTSSIIQAKLGVPNKCAAFDVGLGCTGYIYGLNIAKSFMEANGYKKGLLFTCDSLTSSIDKNDKTSAILFGDAATVTFLSDKPRYDILKPTHYTYGEHADVAVRTLDNKFSLQGQSIFLYSLQYMPKVLNENLIYNGIAMNDIELFILHQANKYMVQTITEFAKIDKNKVPFDIEDYGNTGPSSIPIILAKNINKNYPLIMLSAVGDGFSISCMPIQKHIVEN